MAIIKQSEKFLNDLGPLDLRVAVKVNKEMQKTFLHQ